MEKSLKLRKKYNKVKKNIQKLILLLLTKGLTYVGGAYMYIKNSQEDIKYC